MKMMALALAVAAIQVTAAEAKPLSGAEIQKAVSGRTISGTEDGEAYVESLQRDGSLTGRSAGESYGGKWSVRGNQLCLVYDGDDDDDDEDCSQVEITGNTVTFTGNGPASKATLK